MNRQIVRTYSIFTRCNNYPANCCILHNGIFYGKSPNVFNLKSKDLFYRLSSDKSDKQLSAGQKLKTLVAEYGTTVIVFHVTISLISLGTFYTLIANGVDVDNYMKRMGFGSEAKLAAGAGTFVVSYAVHKVFAPVRLGITAVSVPLIVRYLRSRGILKKK